MCSLLILANWCSEMLDSWTLLRLIYDTDITKANYKFNGKKSWNMSYLFSKTSFINALIPHFLSRSHPKYQYPKVFLILQGSSRAHLFLVIRNIVVLLGDHLGWNWGGLQCLARSWCYVIDVGRIILYDEGEKRRGSCTINPQCTLPLSSLLGYEHFVHLIILAILFYDSDMLLLGYITQLLWLILRT